MSERLGRRLRLLEQRTITSTPICAEHPASTANGPHWREAFMDSLRAVSPDPADRAIYEAQQDALEATPPCGRCGWRPDVIRIKADPNWGGAA
jgi:hypothetical protein